jgi:hypothetical protein
MSAPRKISRRQELFLVALLSGDSVIQAAAKAGVTDRQARRWLYENETFAKARTEAQRRIFQEALGELRAVAGEAVRRLRQALSDTNSAIAVRAAAELLTQGRDCSGLIDLAERIERMEKYAEKQATRPKQTI